MRGDQIRIALAIFMLAFVAGACEQTPTNSNTTNGNKAANANSNKVIVTNANSNTMANSNKSDRDITRSDFDKEKDKYAREAKEAGRKIGAGADDLWIWTKTRAALAAADDLRDSTVSVDVDNNIVTLTGSVANAAQKSKAQQVAQEIEGVRSVKNQLVVTASATTTNGNRKGA